MNAIRIIEDFFRSFMSENLINQGTCKQIINRKTASELCVLSLVHEFLTKNIKSTKRNIYYLNVELFGSQAYVDFIIESICNKIGLSRSELNIEASNRSLIYGDVTIDHRIHDSIDCLSSSNGVSLSSDFEISKDSFRQLKFVLVVEKDATFRYLIGQGFCEIFRPCALVTSKGFPDLNCRVLLNSVKLNSADFPIFCLVDADPYGLSIYCTYKYGSKKASFKNSERQILQSNNITLLGLLATDLEKLQFQKNELLPLSSADCRLLEKMKSRDYYETDPEIKIQVECFLKLKMKAEIQCLNSLGPSYLVSEYLYKKITNCGITPTKVL